MARRVPNVLRQPMAWAVIAALAVGAVIAAAAVAFVREYEGGAVETMSIVVTGQGTVRAVPDTATVYVGAAVVAPTVGDARQQVGRRIDALIQTLTSQLGIAKEDIATQHINIFPQYDFSEVGPGRQPQPIGYRAEHVLLVRVRKIDSVGEIVDGAVETVGSDILLQGTFFTIEDVAGPQEEARKEAYENARKAAEQLATAAGLRLGGAIAISEVSAAQSLPFPAAAAGRAVGKGGGEVLPGQQDISVVLQVTFAVE